MLEQNIKAVKEAENKAEQLIAEAKAEAVKIEESAWEKAKEIRLEAEKEALSAEETVLARATEMGEEHKAEVRKETDKELEAIRAMAKTKESAAVDLVINELI